MSDLEKKFDLVKRQRIEDVKKMYHEYGIEVRKEFSKQNSGNFLLSQESDKDVRTIKLSNSTTPLACF